MNETTPIDIEYVLGGVRAKCKHCKAIITIEALYPNNVIIGEKKYCSNCGRKIDWTKLNT